VTTKLTTTLLVFSILALSSCNDKSNTAIASVKIGTQVWTTKNLDVSIFRNGEPIPEIESQKEFAQAGMNGKPACCCKTGDPKGVKYGKFYNWYAVNDSRGLAPQGWHIPSDKEWRVLINYFGGNQLAGEKMRSRKDWCRGDNWDANDSSI
jgi:uncharacterized protein (TIGR02145 family)